MTQNTIVLEYLKKWGSITTAEAFDNLGITRLASRIHELRKMGYEIITEKVTRKNRYGKKVTFARYRLV